jgi:hypothetical protein
MPSPELERLAEIGKPAAPWRRPDLVGSVRLPTYDSESRSRAAIQSFNRAISSA